MERAGKGDELGLARPFARELERAFVRLGAGVAEERLAAERFRQLDREPLARLGAIEIGHMNQSRIERPQHRVSNHGTVVAERVHRDPGDEVEIARAVFRDQLGPFAGGEDGTNARVDAEQCCGVSGRQWGCHAD